MSTTTYVVEVRRGGRGDTWVEIYRCDEHPGTFELRRVARNAGCRWARARKLASP